MSETPTILPLEGVLRLYQSKPIALPYFETNPQHPNKLIFIPGLTDTMGVVPYLPPLASVLNDHEYSLIQMVKCSDLGGFGTSSLEGDAQEIAQLAEHVLTRSDTPCTGNLVLMGHSTGCQDVVTFLSRERQMLSVDAPLRVHGAICQAPVSDREYFDSHEGREAAGQQKLAASMAELDKGKQGALLDRSNVLPAGPTKNGRGNGNAAVALDPAMTAYRFSSLNGSGGDDDLFSSDFDTETIREKLRPALDRAPLLMLFGADEYVLSY